MSNIGYHVCAALFVAGAPFAGVSAAAQTTTPTTLPQSDSSSVAEVVVTALKRSERLQDVPASISAFTSKIIQQAHIENVSDVAKLVPNVSITQGEEPGEIYINIRGVGQIHNGEPPVAVVVDGVQLYDINQISQNLVDIDRIEVLKGPQGAVYGRDAIGGAINIVTRQPTDAFSGALTAKLGDYDLREVEATASGPIVADRLLFRIAADVRSFGGDIQDVTDHTSVNDEHSNDVRATLVAKPVDKLKIEVTGSRDYINSGAAYYSFLPPGSSPNDIAPPQSSLLGRSDRLLENASIKADYDLGAAILTSITGYDLTRTGLRESFDYLPADYLSATQNISDQRISQEFRFTSNGSGPFKWLAGGDYLKTNRTIQSDVFLDPGATGVLTPVQITAPTLFAATGAFDDDNAYALFGQASYRLGRWALSADLRYDLYSDQETENSPGNPEFKKDFEALEPKLTLSYFVTPEDMIYATAGEGFRSGGFNPDDRLGRIYQPEKDWNYESGFKTSWLHRRLTWNGAAFFTEVYDRQIYILDLVTASQTIVNPVKAAYIAGLESDVAAKLTQNLDLTFSSGLLHTRITSYDTAALVGTTVDGDYTGNKLPETPEWSYAVALQYHHPIGPIEGSIRGEFTGNGGDDYWTVDNVEKRKDVNLTNLRASLDYKNYSFSVFVQNLFNDIYIVDYEAQRWSGAPFGNYNLRSSGRLVEASLSAKF